MPYASNNNAVLINGCKPLLNPSVLLEVTEDVATTAGTGWSLQLNSFPPAGQFCQTSQINWLQYIVIVQGGVLSYYIQYWALGASTWPTGYTAQAGTTPWLPCWAHDFGIAPNFGTVSADTLPSRSKLQIQLNTNDQGGVVSATFTYTDPNGKVQSGLWKAPVVHPIIGFELNFVGAPGGNATFTQGLTNSRGIIYYSVSSGGELSVQSGGPGSACGEYSGAVTGELSNMTYSDITGAPAGTVTQILQQPVPCAITSIALTKADLATMTQIRDSTVAKSPAGQWLIDVLDDHSADLAVLAAADKSDLVQTARDLLAKATQIVGQKGVFDGATVDSALKLLGQVSGKLPPSMNGVSAAGATLLGALRGKTLEDGLQEASKTILPRFKAPPTLIVKEAK